MNNYKILFSKSLLNEACDSLAYKIIVKFNRDFIEVSGNAITIGIKSKPVKGKANREIIKKLAKYFNVSSSKIRIVSGIRSKNKIVEID